MENQLPLVLVAVYFLEGTLTGSIGLAIMKVRPEIKKILLYGVLLAATAFLVRNILGLVGWHILIILASNSVYLTAIFRIPYKKSVYVAVLGFIVAAISDSLLVLPLFMLITGLSMEQITGSQQLMAQAFIPHLLLLGAVALGTYRARGFHKKEEAVPEA